MSEPGATLGGSTLSVGDGRPKKPGAPAPRPHLFLALECDRPLAGPIRFNLADVDEVVLGRGTERRYRRSVEGSVRKLEIRIPDPWMSSTHARMTRVLGRWLIEDTQSKNGTILNGAACERESLADGSVIELGHTFFLYRDGLPASPEDAPELESSKLSAPAAGLGTLLPSLERDFAALVQIAASPVSVVLQGESGTGKEVVARALHGLSGRRGPFVAVNCGAIPDNLVESELFGYKKGAFSGATEDRPGLIRSADGGTLFLDEIGDLPPSSQAAFLRVLQEREVLPIGSTRPVSVDIRLVAATHRDLPDLVTRGDFREDLLARVTGFTLRLPPLRDRLEDLGVLVDTLLRRLAPERASRVTFTCEAARALYAYEWPLNIRELEKALGAAVVLAGDGPVDLEHLPESVRTAPEGRPKREKAPELTEEDERRREELIALFKEHRGNVSAVARAMGKARMQIQRWMKRYGIDPALYR